MVEHLQMNVKIPTVVVGMSGGVDSSVAALLLKQQGYRVIGMFMKNWEEQSDGVCSASADYEDVIQVCQKIDIPCYTVNFAAEYRERVFSHFIAEYKAGHTPNPDILCNREIKFKVFFDKAMSLGADYLATGHYCQNVLREGECALARGFDSNKDQTYFLYTINSETLKRVLFPIGHLQKAYVRQLAAEAQLITSHKKDSTGICFIGKRDFRPFLQQYLQPLGGDVETPEGKIVGKHEGIAYYTIGQRRGLNIGGAGEAWFVVGKDVMRNVLIAVQGENHPLLYQTYLSATDINWVSQNSPQFPLRCTAKIRYRQSDAPCTITREEDGRIWIQFDSPQKAVTPRQSIVFYDGEFCLGGAMIEKGGVE